MSNKQIRLLKLLVIPILYLAIILPFWSYARYQQLNLAEFTIPLGLINVVAAGAWAYLNKLSKGAVVILVAAVAVAVALQFLLYYYLSSIPTGWDNLQY